MTPRDAMRCAGWSLRLAAWSKLTQWGRAASTAAAWMGVEPVRGTWRRRPDWHGMTCGEGDLWRLVRVREWVAAGPVVFAVGDRVVWVLSAEKEQR